ncbi:OTU domain-containing protein [Trichonephila inaurata madagascariensis]|uniref:OTU domain-containing protein n=1 Tax=Trichonephila inaurata madagascariensis TaxID=2747483 RepID=A0A8X6YR08_9ARAC|nr:OTU domain-containing protein [Trichonephila inaurata madagascariensis]
MRTQVKSRRRRKKPYARKRKMPPRQKKTPSPDTSKYTHHTGAKFKIYSITGDGNCLFRAMAYFALGRQNEHAFVRQQVVKYICDHWDRFKNFVPELDKAVYRKRMNSLGTFGSEAEIVAFTEVFSCKVSVYFKDSPDRDPLVFGDSPTECFVLYSGMTDCGHYDVLHPNSRVTCNISFHKESIRGLRRKTLEQFGRHLDYFKESEQNSHFHILFTHKLLNKKKI